MRPPPRSAAPPLSGGGGAGVCPCVREGGRERQRTAEKGSEGRRAGSREPGVPRAGNALPAAAGACARGWGAPAGERPWAGGAAPAAVAVRLLSLLDSGRRAEPSEPRPANAEGGGAERR